MKSKVTLREELIFILNQAAELEHSLTCSYLFTALSLKNRADEGLSEERVDLVRSWKDVFNEVAIDEMMHLAIVNNMLVALGAAPHFDRPNFPHDCAYYMPGLEVGLLPFNEDTLRHFILVEQPDGSNLGYGTDLDAAERIQGDLINRIGADPLELDSQGDLYGLIASGMRHLSMRLGEENLFIGPPARPALKDFLASCGWHAVEDLKTALRAVAQIVEQGEGASGDNPDSHFAKFNNILKSYQAIKQQDPSFEPAYPVLSNPFARTPPEVQGAVNLIDNDLAIDVSDLFNEVYGTLLLVLGRFFALTEETEEEANALCNAAIALMKDAVVPLGDVLMQLPAGTAHAGLRAGPSFVVRTMHVLPYKDSAWRLLKERFDELAGHARSLSISGGEAALLVPVHEALLSISGMFSESRTVELT